MEPSEIIWMVQFLENLSSSRMFQDLFLDGNNQSSSEGMPLVINIKQLILLLINQENSRLLSKVMTEHNKKCKYTNLKEKVVLVLECITLTKVLNNLLTAASSLLF